MRITLLAVIFATALAAAANPFELNPAKPAPEEAPQPAQVDPASSASQEKTLDKVSPEEAPAAKTEEAPAQVEDAPAAESHARRKKKEHRPAKITAARTLYDRKEGFAYFEGGVCVDDEEYQMHADKVYVFLEGTNELKRIVALGNVAMTNGMRRAYAAKASYYRRNSRVVLDSAGGAPAEVRDESKGEAQSVRGTKIKFWTDSEQVEVIGADISAPVKGGVKGGLGGLKEALGK